MNGDLYPRVAFKVLRRGNNLLAEATQSYPGVPLRIHLSGTKEPGTGSIKITQARAQLTTSPSVNL